MDPMGYPHDMMISKATRWVPGSTGQVQLLLGIEAIRDIEFRHAHPMAIIQDPQLGKMLEKSSEKVPNSNKKKNIHSGFA